MEKVVIHRLYVRIFHWLNAISMVIMIMSGWQIFMANPTQANPAYTGDTWTEWLSFPEWITLGGWLGGGIQFHLATMWIFVANLLVYVILGLLTGHFRSKMLPLTPSGLFGDLKKALTFRLPHDSHDYNCVQKTFYVGIIAVMLLIFASGLVTWKPVQFQTLGLLLGGYEGARRVHLICMVLICAFIVVHLALVAIVPSTLLPMITGRAKPFPKKEQSHAA